jgi:flagellar protein FliO/FliZ
MGGGKFLQFSKKNGVAVIVFLICMTGLLSAQDQKPGGTETSASPQTADTSATHTSDAAAGPVDESTIVINPAAPEQSSVTEKEPSTLGLFVRMIIVLIIVLACIYFVVLLMKRGLKPGRENDPFLRKVASLTLAPGKTIQIITLIDHAYIVGVTDNAVNLVGEVADKELIEAMNLYADKNANSVRPRSFGEVLELFTAAGSRGKKTGVFSESAEKISDLLKTQRKRFNDGDNL